MLKKKGKTKKNREMRPRGRSGEGRAAKVHPSHRTHVTGILGYKAVAVVKAKHLDTRATPEPVRAGKSHLVETTTWGRL